MFILLTFLLLSHKKMFYLLIISIFITEFFWIKIGEGIFRISYFLSIVVLLGFLLLHTQKTLLYLSKSKLILLMFSFLLYNFFLILFGVINKPASLFSFGLLIIMVTFTINFYLFLRIYKEEQRFLKFLAFSSLIAIVFGLLQYAIFTLFGKPLTFTSTQSVNILFNKRITSFFTEGDTFGKNIMVITLLLLPFVYKKQKTKIKTERTFKWSHYIFALYVLTLALNSTRSAIAGFFAGLIVLFYLILINKKGKLLFLKTLMNFIVIISLTVGTLLISGHLSFLTQRLSSILAIKKTLQTDASAVFRYQNTIEPLKKFVKSGPKNILLGSGWTTIKTEFGEFRLEMTSNIFVTFFIYSGLLGLFLFLLIILKTFRTFYVTYKKKSSYLALGGLLSLTGALAASQMAPMTLAPEFWMLFGIASYLETTL